MTERVAAASTSALDEDGVIPKSERRALSLGAEKRFSPGTALSLDAGIDRLASNNNAARNPDHSSVVGLTLRQPVLRGAGRRVNLAPLARAVLAVDRSLFALRGAVLDVLTETELAYLELVRARASRQLTLSSIEQAEALLEENRERERLGAVTPLEVLQAETVLTQRQEDLIRAERRIDDALDALASVMGTLPLDSSENPDFNVGQLPQKLPALSPMGEVVSRALENDTEASLQERVLEIQRIDRLVAEDAVKPELDLVGGLRYSGRDQDGLDSFRGAAERQDGYNWRAGVELRFPWGARAAQARLRQAERSVVSAEVELVRLKQEKALATRNAWRAVDEGRQRIDVARKALRLSELSFEQERARYQAGVIPYRNVLEAQRDLDAARANELEVRADTLQAFVRLSRIDGTLLERHGYSWQITDGLREPNDFFEHPLSGMHESDS
jgi:outer membrane protein TolC